MHVVRIEQGSTIFQFADVIAVYPDRFALLIVHAPALLATSPALIK
jgi:hypothetical protein